MIFPGHYFFPTVDNNALHIPSNHIDACVAHNLNKNVSLVYEPREL
jgi:hypothetical protein